ncbi:MAG: DUF6335 family protein [Cyanobacteria bacterium P01_A01_bin.114]
MENTDSLPKQQAVDGKAAFAGNPEPEPTMDVVDTLAAEAGVSAPMGEAVNVKAALDARDKDRWELNPDSAQQ